MRQPGPFLVGLYAWTATMASGAVLVDVVWATQVPRSSPEVLAEVSDFLLIVASLTVITAIGAIAVAWGWKPARYPLVASLVLVVVGVLAPALLADIIRDAESAFGVRIGPWLRIGDAGLASILAFVGLRSRGGTPNDEAGHSALAGCPS